MCGLLLTFMGTRDASAQSAGVAVAGAITGSVVDPQGAVIPQAGVSITCDGATPVQVTTDALGRYAATGLTPGQCSIDAQAPGFRTTRKEGVRLAAGATQRITLTLEIDVAEQQVVVSGNAVDSSPEKNGDAIVMKGDTLRSLSNDPDVMRQQLESIAGSDPENGPQLLVDGFSGGKMPPKSAIREIRINQNPYSAQYDSIGYGRIEIFTKPGADKWHAEIWLSGNDSAWNARNPFTSIEPDYHSVRWGGDMNGPLSKKSSLFTSTYGMNGVNESVVNAQTLDDALNQVTVRQILSTPSTELSFSPRFDLQWGKVQTITLRYELNRSSQSNGGVGQLALASQAYDSTNTEQTLQFSDVQAYGAKVLNETRFQYIRDRNRQTPQSTDPAVNVSGAFLGGGSSTGILRDAQDHYEFQDYLHVAAGTHDVNVGTRLRELRDSNYSTSGYNGQFTFTSLTAYQITEQGLKAGKTAEAIRAEGGGATQFTQVRGTPSIAVKLFDAGIYAEDNWKVRPQVTLSYGLRFETQTGIHDHADVAPRAGLAWSIPGKKDKPPVAVIRAGYGWFYSRFESTNLLQARRQNGIVQQTSVIANPDFFPGTCADASVDCSTATNTPTIYQINPTLRAPIQMVGGIGVDKPIGKFGQVSVTYMHWRGARLFLTRNSNAPLPGTYDPSDPTSGTRPLGINENIYEYESIGASKRNRVNVNANLHAKGAALWFYYGYGRAHSNTGGIGTFLAHPYDPHADYGRATYDLRHRVFVGGDVRLPGKVRLDPFVMWRSGMPFDIVVSRDLNGDSQFNDRPAFATDLSRASVHQTKWGAFDADPIAGQTIIPVNYGKGPGAFLANLRLSRALQFGPELPQDPPPPAAKDEKAAPAKAAKKEIERKYGIDFGFEVQNLFNHPNYAQPVGVLDSSLFGKSTSAQDMWGNGSQSRSINLEMFFHF